MSDLPQTSAHFVGDRQPLFKGMSGAQAKATTPPPISAIAARLAVSEARLLLRYALQRGWAILPKSVREDRMRDNMDLGSFALGDDDMAQLDSMESDQALAFGEPGAAFDPSKVP